MNTPLRFVHIVLIASASLAAGCSGGSDSAVIDRNLIEADIYEFWTEASAPTAESLELQIEDVVDRACINAAVQEFSDADAEKLTAQAQGDITDDISDAGFDIYDAVREDCIDFTGGGFRSDTLNRSDEHHGFWLENHGARVTFEPERASC